MSKQIEATKPARSTEIAALNDSAMTALESKTPQALSLTTIYLDVDALNKGDKFRCFYAGIKTREQTNTETGEVKTMDCAMLITQREGRTVTLESAASVLVRTLQESGRNGLITPFVSMLEITYLGKQKNKTNAFSSARWDIRQLG